MPRLFAAIGLCLAAASVSQAAGVLSYWNLDEGTSEFVYDPVGYKDGWLMYVPDGHEPWVAGHTGAAGDYAIDFAGAATVDLGEPTDWGFGKQTPVFYLAVAERLRHGRHDGTVHLPQSGFAPMTVGASFDGW